MQIMQIFQSKYDFVTSKRFNNKIKEYEKLGFVITNSVIDDCNLAYLDQVLLWLNPTRYLSYVEEKKFPFPMAFDNKFLFRCENAPPTPVVEIAESYIPTGIDDPNLPDDYLPF